jgi:hypothetical protein
MPLRLVEVLEVLEEELDLLGLEQDADIAEMYEAVEVRMYKAVEDREVTQQVDVSN